MHDRFEPRRSATDALSGRRLVVVSGKGGVGRTTAAALLALELASAGRRVLLATTGGDDRLAWWLGRPSLEPVAVEVGPNLWVQRLVPAACVVEYASLILRSERISRVVFQNELVAAVLRAVPGLDDFAVLGKVWHEAVRGKNYDVVVFDGPATGHLRLCLGVPEALTRAMPAGPLVREAEQMREALRDPAVSTAVLVARAETWPLTEVGQLAQALREDFGISVALAIVNEVLDRTWGGPLAEPPSVSEVEPSLAPAVTIVDQLRRRARGQAEALATVWPRGAPAQLALELPWVPGGIRSAADFEVLWRGAATVAHAPGGAS